jgi:hypothetical protein
MTHAAYLETIRYSGRHRRTRRPISCWSKKKPAKACASTSRPATWTRTNRWNRPSPRNLEETAHDFTPTALVGMYMSRYVSSHRHRSDLPALHLLRHAGRQARPPLDDGILRAVWMTYDELAACADRHRSPPWSAMRGRLSGRQARAAVELLQTHPSVLENCMARKQ